MKDSRFIELLNLYIDRQITAGETRELEAELQSSPRRQAVYRQYCQIHRATTLVGESFRAGAPALPVSERATMLRFESGKTAARTRWAYYAGGLAAACLAVVFVRFNGSTGAGSIAPVEPAVIASQPATPAPTVIVASAPLAPAPVATERERSPEVRPGLVSLRNIQANTPQDYAAMLAALRREEREAYASGQIQPAKLPSLFDDGVFESPRYYQNPAREFRTRTSSPAQQAEFTAFQFQR